MSPRCLVSPGGPTGRPGGCRTTMHSQTEVMVDSGDAVAPGNAHGARLPSGTAEPGDQLGMTIVSGAGGRYPSLLCGRFRPSPQAGEEVSGGDRHRLQPMIVGVKMREERLRLRREMLQVVTPVRNPGRVGGQGRRTSRPAALRSMMARSAAGASSSGSSEEMCGRMRPAAAQPSSASAEARSRSGRRLR